MKRLRQRARWPRRRSPEARDKGAISVLVAISAASLVVLVGVVLDFGGRLRAIENADARAQEAARFAGQQLDEKALRDGLGYRLVQSTARDAALTYLQRLGLRGNVNFPDPQTITVTVDTEYRTALLGAVRINTLSVHGHGKATLLHGVTEAENG
ncbi:hypothetical protein ACGFX4_02215 [Kitasatospora sp. NPDC048365]|uniref:hypothetical protein n=1 Tax=Kitasatospora sp. NPDC048365 TaxID=3364050 RepID=UPI00371656F3